MFSISALTHADSGSTSVFTYAKLNVQQLNTVGATQPGRSARSPHPLFFMLQALARTYIFFSQLKPMID